MSDLAPFDPSRLVDDVRARVQATFAMMIPEDEWKRLVEREIKAFLNPSEDRYHVRQVAGLSKLVIGELEVFFRQKIKDELAKPEWTVQYAGGGTSMSGMMKQLMIEHAPALFAATFGMMFQQAVETMKFR